MEHSNKQMEVRWSMVRLLFILLFSVSVCYGQANRFAGFGSRNTCPVEALKFIDSSGITDQTQKDAICTLVKQLQDSSLWTKMVAVYPFVGGTASTHKWNLKNPVNSDAAYRIVFFGGWTHSSNGALPNGINAYADTRIRAAQDIGASSIHFSKFNRTNDLTGNKIDGTFDVNNSTFFHANYSAGNAIVGSVGSILTYTPTDTRGFFVTSRTSLSLIKTFRNGTLLGTNTTAITVVPDFVYTHIGARAENTGDNFYNTYECAFASYGTGLTDAEASTLYNIVNAFQTTLGR
jgi:hypothetical protein